MVDRTGQQLGSYRLSRLLGRGGFAEVYLGEHVRLNNYAAVKVLNAALADSEADSFQHEAHTIARLLHPHIIRVFDYDVAEGTPFLIMDYAPNGTLRSTYPKGTRIPFVDIGSYVKQVAGALQYAHNEKVIHRDIKPENMLLGRNKEVLLSDFGIATMSQSSRYQNTQDIVGTAAYMAPEQIQGKPHPASDQYSLAIVVYEWLTGERPFHGSFTEIAVQHMFVNPQPLHEKVSDIPPEIEQVLQIALAKDLRQRFANVQAFANALEQACISSRPIWNVMPVQTSSASANIPSLSSVEPLVSNSPISSVPPTMETPVPNTPPTIPVTEGNSTVAATQYMNTPIPNFSSPITPIPSQSTPIFSRRAVLVAGLVVAGGGVAGFAFLYNSGIFSKSLAPSSSSQLTSTTQVFNGSQPTSTTQVSSTSTATEHTFRSSWSLLPSLPYPTADNTAIYVHTQQQDYIYMTGGYRGASQSPHNDDTLYRYNIATSQWEVAASNFPGMYNNAVVQDQQQNLYFTGGYSPDSRSITTLLYVYQPTTGVQRQIVPPGQIQFGYAGSMLADQSGHLYLMQGFMQVNGSYSSAGTGWYRYNIAQDQWDMLASLPVGVGYAVLAFDSQGDIVLMGGVKDTEQTNGTNGIYRYNIAQNSWTAEQQSAPQAFNGAASCAIGNGQVVVVGGYDPTTKLSLNNVWLIDLNTLNAKCLAPFPGGGARLGVAACDRAGNVYVTRGTISDSAPPTAEFLRLS